jgi:hypothetical protein
MHISLTRSSGPLEFLLAKRAGLLLAEPFLDAVHVEEVLAGQPVDFLLGVYVTVANRAQLAFYAVPT